MNPLKKLAGQTLIYGMGTIVPRLLNYLLLTPFYTRIFLKGEYGVITELYAYAAFLLVLLTYGMETSFFRFSQTEKKSEEVYSTSLVSLLFTSSFFILLILFFYRPIAGLIRYDANPEYIIYFAFIIGLDAFTSIPFARLRQKEKAFRFALIKIINVSVNIGLNLFFFILCPILFDKNPDNPLLILYNPDFGIAYAFISNLAASFISLLLLLPDLVKIRWVYNRRLLLRMLSYALPLLIIGLAGMVNEVSDKILIKYLLRVPDNISNANNYVMEQLGIYGANFKLAVLMTLFIQMFRYAAEPFFFAQEKEKNSRIVYASVMKYFVVSAMLIFLMVTLYIDVFKLFIGSDFRAGLHIVPLILMANFLQGIFYNLSVWYKLTNKTRYGAIIAICGALVTIVLNVVLIPVMGYSGAAWAHLFCYATMVSISYFWGRKHFRVDYDIKKILVYVLSGILIFFISRTLSSDNLAQNMLYKSLLMVVFLLVVFFTSRKELFRVFIRKHH